MSSCIFVLIKDEHLYLDEFITYHQHIGIDHIFVVEDCDSKTHKDITDKYDDVTLLSVLDLFLDKDKILYQKAHQYKMQIRYLKAGLNFIKENYEYTWCFVIDVDEFITTYNNENVNDVLERYSSYDSVVLQWQNYGANGIIHTPDYSNRSITDIYTEKIGFQNSDNNSWYQKVKTVYNMTNFTIRNFMSDHVPNRYSKWCKTDYSQNKEALIYDNIYIRHYITKSWEEYVRKIKIRGMFFSQHRSLDSFFEMNPNMLYKKDELIGIVQEIENGAS